VVKAASRDIQFRGKAINPYCIHAFRDQGLDRGIEPFVRPVIGAPGRFFRLGCHVRYRLTFADQFEKVVRQTNSTVCLA
jgi:hypothetical protein